MKKLVPFLFPASLLALFIVTVYARLTGGRNLWAGQPLDCELAIIVMYTVWICCEIAVAKNETRQEGRSADRGTREFYGIAQALVVLSALMFEETWSRPGPAHLAGILLFAAGISLRAWAIRSLGAFYAHAVRMVDGHRVIDTGPYRRIRHPAYAGNLAAHAGIALFFLNPVTASLFILVFVPSIAGRIHVEEKVLMEIDGYREFARDRRRLIPGIW